MPVCPNYAARPQAGNAFLPPEGAETARLTVTLGEDYGDPVDYGIEGQKEDGLFFIQLRSKQSGGESLQEYSIFQNLLFHREDLDACPWTLAFFDKGGRLLAAVS